MLIIDPTAAAALTLACLCAAIMGALGIIASVYRKRTRIPTAAAAMATLSPGAVWLVVSHGGSVPSVVVAVLWVGTIGSMATLVAGIPLLVFSRLPGEAEPLPVVVVPPAPPPSEIDETREAYAAILAEHWVRMGQDAEYRES